MQEMECYGKRQKISICRGETHTAGTQKMEIDRNKDLLDHNFSTIPLPLTTMAGYAIKSSKWLTLSRYKKYGQKERGKKMSKGEVNSNNNKSRLNRGQWVCHMGRGIGGKRKMSSVYI